MDEDGLFRRAKLVPVADEERCWLADPAEPLEALVLVRRGRDRAIIVADACLPAQALLGGRHTAVGSSVSPTSRVWFAPAIRDGPYEHRARRLVPPAPPRCVCERLTGRGAPVGQR